MKTKKLSEARLAAEKDKNQRPKTKKPRRA
jgi:hypothetical protein